MVLINILNHKMICLIKNSFVTHRFNKNEYGKNDNFGDSDRILFWWIIKIIN